MAAISLSYLTSAINARVFLRCLLSSHARRIRYRLASPLTRWAALVAFLGVLWAVSLAPELFAGVRNDSRRSL
ncbi:hypothetical protein [uncultured Bilophila sp.]|uniref:hypothetical protein n=2 Tax=uncultured Bilophila sp. TaxID=529385 RepID=UPI0025FA4900|nr:hypothetical protein [uncultured Bilophila sp.]